MNNTKLEIDKILDYIFSKDYMPATFPCKCAVMKNGQAVVSVKKTEDSLKDWQMVKQKFSVYLITKEKDLYVNPTQD